MIDDYAPGGAASDVQRLQREAARLIRAQGNRAGRSRLRPDGTLRPTKPPRCTILSTGEDIPGGQSIRARLFVVEVGAGDIDQAKLTSLQAQAAAGMFAGAMAAFIARLATDLDGARERFRRRGAELRSQVQASHRRTAWMTGELGAALELYLELAGALDRWPDCWQALLRTAAAQEQHQADEDPARRFLALVGALLSSRQVHLGCADQPDVPPAKEIAGRIGWQADPPAPGYPTTWRAHGPRIGWIADEIVYLDPEAAFGAAQRLASGQGATIAVGAKTLWKRLAAAGLLGAKDEGKNTTKATIGDQRQRVIAISAAHLSIVPEWGQQGQSGQKAPNTAEAAGSRPHSAPPFSDDPEKQGQKMGAEPQGNGASPEVPPPSPPMPPFSEHDTEPVDPDSERVKRKRARLVNRRPPKAAS